MISMLLVLNSFIRKSVHDEFSVNAEMSKAPVSSVVMSISLLIGFLFSLQIVGCSRKYAGLVQMRVISDCMSKCT